ncbi:DUF7410 domain-containing protein [Haloarchaeobius baliensis]|uniref:DUF7410 domain-containing protein n=1 Tax=Haloarchaeobius baliensis TaxID=1670458 RepID=UPI003F883476
MTTTQDHSTDGTAAPGDREPPSTDGDPGTDSPPTFHVPDGEEPAAVCERCGQPFPTQDHHDLHLGEVHADELDDTERERYEEAVEAETDELFVYHLKVIAGLASLYAVLVLVYMVVLSL